MNKDKIFNGTLEKRFVLARKKMSENYTSGTIDEFYAVYKDAPLSFILNHSRDIFSESYRGLEFYVSIIESEILDTDVYRREEKKVATFIGEATNKGMPKNQLEMYHSLHDRINELINRYAVLNEIFQNVYATTGGRAYVECVVDELYDAGKDYKYGNSTGDYDVLHNATRDLDIIAAAIFTSKSIYATFGLGVFLVNKYPQYASLLADFTDGCLVKNSDMSDTQYRRQRVGINIIKKLMTSEYVINFLMILDNSRLSSLWYRIKNESIDNLCPIPIVKMEDPGLPYTPSVDSHNIADLENFIEDLDDNPNVIIERYDFCKYMAAKLSADLECFGEYDNLTDSKKAIYESMDDLQNYYEAEYMMLEWEDDGSPNPVIKRHIMTSKERAAEQEKERKKESTPINNLERSVNEETKKDDAENDLCEKINATITEVQKVSPSDEESVASRNKEIISAAKKDFGEYKKELDKHPEYSRAKALCSKLIDDIKDVDGTMEEDANEELEGRYDQFMMEEIKDDLRATSSFTPKNTSKPKPDFLTRVQNKALDKAAKNSERYAARKEKEQKLVNVGKALSEDPKRTGGEVKSFVKKWDAWDENRRKEFLLKPGFRHKIFKNFRVALMYGAVAHIKLAYIPLLGLFRHCSKMKDARIRNEVSRELEAEIKICDEKISDANAKGDTESKYELMRIKEKLEAERSRVRTNSKYV